MDIREAAAMIACRELGHDLAPATWADLGCGSGVFTRALAALLPHRSTIYAVDSTNILQWSQPPDRDITCHFRQGDFVKDDWQLPPLDGILMANALHYVKDKDAFLEKITGYGKPDVSFLIVEYDTDLPVMHWVPYPIQFSLLSDLFSRHGFPVIRKLQERPSVYRRGHMYSALIQKER